MGQGPLWQVFPHRALNEVRGTDTWFSNVNGKWVRPWESAIGGGLITQLQRRVQPWEEQQEQGGEVQTAPWGSQGQLKLEK
jgi:hypothetical protein